MLQGSLWAVWQGDMFCEAVLQVNFTEAAADAAGSVGPNNSCAAAGALINLGWLRLDLDYAGFNMLQICQGLCCAALMGLCVPPFVC